MTSGRSTGPTSDSPGARAADGIPGGALRACGGVRFLVVKTHSSSRWTSRWCARSSSIRGMGKCDEHFVIILDVDRVFSSNELFLVKEVGEPVAAG